MATINESILDDSVTLSSDYSLLGAFSHPLPVEIVISTIVWLMCFLAVTGNILVFVVVLRDKQLRSNVANIYILNLASADLCVGLNSLTLINLWRYSGNWLFQRALCTFWLIVDYSACMQSAFAVTLISLDRYLLVTKFLKYRKYQSTSLAMGLVAATWSTSLLFNALPILGDGLWPNARSFGVVNYSVTCDSGVFYILSYNIAQIVIGFVVPAIVMAYLNFKVYANILRRSKGLVRTTQSQPSATVEGGNDPALQSCVNADSQASAEPAALDTKRAYKKHRKAAITLVIIVGMFSLCWVPYYVIQFMFIVGKIKFSRLVWNAVYYIVWVNSAINPFIYAATSPRIRRRLVEIICFWNRRLAGRIRPM